MSNWWESSPVDGNTSDNAASKNWWDEHPKEEASQDSALTRGITQAKSAAKTAKALSIGDYETVAQLAAERDAYRKANPGTKEGNELMSAWDSGDGIAGGIKNVVGEIGKDWKEAPSTFDALRATGKNLSAMGGGIVEQVPNMVMPMTGMLAGGAAGSTVGGPFGAVVGGWAGATAGNAAAESPEQVDRALQSAGIDPQDTAAAKSYLDANGGKIAGQALTKGAIIGAVDTATMGIGGKVLTAPARAAADRALREMGVDLADKAAVKAAQRTTEFANKIGADAVYQASQKGAQAFTRNTAVGALEPAGEFAGEYFGQGAATGDWDTKGATLEALSSLGQSGITFAGQKAYQYATNPFSKATANTDTPKADVPRVNDYTLVTDPAPIQQRIDAMLRIDRSAINEKERIAYEKAWSDALNEPVGITHDENGIEKPLTMGAYLDAQDQARQIAELRARQNQDPNTATVPNQDGTETVIDRRDGPLSAAAVSSVKNGVLRERDFVPPPTGRFGQMDELANLIDSERQDVEGQRNALVQGQQLRRASELESTDARVEAARIKQTNQQRDALLQNVLENLPEGQNPSRAFDRALRSMGFTDTNFRPEEVRTIANWNNISPAAPEPGMIPSAPNELDAEAMGIRSLDEKQRVIEANRLKFEETRKRIQAQRGGQNGTNAIAPTVPEVATSSLESSSGQLSGSGSVLASTPAGDTGSVLSRAEVAASGVRPAVPAGTTSATGLTQHQGIDNVTSAPSAQTIQAETQGQEQQPAAAITPEVKAYPLGRAKMLAGRMTHENRPTEIYPHPTQPGMYALRPIGENNASRSEPTNVQQPAEAQQATEQVAPIAAVQGAQEVAQLPARRQVKPKTAPIMRRDDLVGAIMRATGGRGIHSNMATTLVGDTANNATRVRGLFTNQGQQDMDDLAMLLREQEGFDVRDASHLEDLVREAAAGNVAKSIERQEREKADAQEKQYRDTIRQKAKKFGIKTVAVKFSDVEKSVLARMEERHNQAVSELDERSQQRFNAALEEAIATVPEEVVDETMAEVTRRGLTARDFWNETTRILRGMVYDARQEAANGTEATTEEVGDGRGNRTTGRGDAANQRDQAPAEQSAAAVEPAQEERPDLALEGQTPAEVRAQEAQRQADEARANRPEPDTTPNVTADQVDLFNTQGGLFNSNRDAQSTTADLPRVDTASAPVASTEQPQQTPLQKLIAANKQKKADENAARAAKLAELMAKRKAEKETAQEEDATNDRDTFTVERVEDNERADVTFKRGEEVKIAGTYPMRTGKIEGISQAQRQFRVDGVWHDFGYAYKTDYDEFASARQDMDKLLSDARQRIADGLGFSRTDGYPIREARALATRYALEGYDATLNELEIEGQRIFDERTKALREEQIAREKAQSDKWQAERDAEAEKYSAPVQMTMDEWKDIHKDYKSYNGGDRTAMIGGRMRAVEIVKPGVEPVVAETAAVEKTETDMTPDWDSFAEFWNGLIEGKGTIDDVKKSFALLVDEADAFRATIAKMKNDQLKRMLGWSARPDDKKADLVRKVYDQTLERFTLNKSAPSKQWTYGEKMEVVEKRYQDQLRAVIDSLTDADLAEFRDSIAENSKARKEALEQKKAAAADPKTLEDFEVYATYSKNTGKTADEARKALTPEQRAAWDSLLAEKSRTARQDSSAQQKAEVKVAAVTTEGQIVETKHTRTGEDLFVVKAAERVDRDVYNQWNATAKRLGGWYSSFRGNGAVPGFQFKTRENANAFLKFLGGDVAEAKEVVQERRDAYADDRSQTAVERLMEMADRLDERADESLGRERKANTDRRARFAAAAENAAQSDKALAKTMRNIAEAIQNGTAKLLDRVRQKSQVEMLQEFIRNAKDAELRSKYPAYIDQERRKGEAPSVDTPEFAQWPSYTADRSDLANLARQLLETEGTKKLGQQLLKIADDVTAEYKKFAKENLHKVSVFSSGREGSDERKSAVFPTEEAAERAIARSGFKGKATAISFKRGEHLVIMGPTMARERGVWSGDDNKRITLAPDSGELLVEKLGKMARTNRDAPRIPWQFENAYDKRKRLAAIGIETPAEFRSALREFIGLRETPKEADRVKEMERAMIGRKNDGLDFFPTPKNVAQQMIEAAELREGMNVLEPSAGWGHIAEMIRDAGVDPEVVELSGDRRELLEAKGFNVVGSDFLETSGQYDRILMNPPFSDRRDAQHVQHAYSLLRPDGRLVAIMGEGVFFGQDKKAEAFRNWLEEVGGTSEKLEEGSFLDPSLPVNTGVNARMVVIDKPAGQAAPVDTENTGPGSQANDGRITTADKAIYGMAAEGKSAADILKFIADTSRNPFYRQLARLLQKTGIAPKIVVGTSDGWKFNAGEGKYAAAYNPKTDTVALFRPASSERNMLHELIHAATLKALSKRGMAAVQMKKLFEHVAKSGKLKGMYGMANVDEFVAEAFSNPKFQQALKKVSAPTASSSLSNAWHWFVRVVRGILGIQQGQENALSRALEIGVELMRENMGLKANAKDGSIQPMPDNSTASGRGNNAPAPEADIGEAKHVKAARQMLEAIGDETYDYGLRVLHDDFANEIKPGDSLPSSFVWENGDITKNELDGVSTAGVRRADIESVIAAMTNLGVTGKNGPNGYYFGNRVVLVRGERNGTGQDVGEVIIRKPEVIGEWKKPKNGLAEVLPNEPTASAGSDADIRYNIIGDSGRAYDAMHHAFFKNVGRDVDRQNVIEKTLDYLKSDFWKKMAVGIVDQFRGLRDLNDGGQAYMLARLSKGTAGAFDALLHHGKLSLKDGAYDGDTSGGFIDRLGVPLHGELDDFLWWVAANRAEGLTAQGKENLFSPQDIQAGKSLAAGMTTFDYTIQTGPSQGTTTRNRQVIYQDALRVFNEFQKNVLDLSEQSGLIDGASRKHWESEFYVPFYRVSEEDGEFVGAKMGNALVRQQAFKKLKGGTDKLNSDLLTNTLMNMSHLIEASAKNRAATAALKAAEKIGAARKAIHGEKNTVWFQENGQNVEYKVEDPFVMTAITSLEYAGMRNGVMDAMTKFKHWLTIGVTASPAFKVRNLIRDSIQAIGTSDLSYNPIKNVTEGFNQTKRDSQAYVSALASGGLIRFGTMLEGSESNRVRQLIKSGVKDSSILNNEAKWRQFYDKYIEPAVSAYNELGNRSEEINRAALYNQLIKQGKSHAEAALLARDLMDFSMQGSFNTIRFLSQVTPFFNARLQGMYKLGRSAKDNPRKLAVVTGAVALASIALMAGYEDDEDWKRREDWDRDGFFWFKFGGIEYRIPKPFEVGAVASLAERSVEYLMNDEMTGERFRKVVGALAMNNLSMNPVPQMVKPIIDLYANKDSFTGRPIESMGMQRLESTMRYNSGTSMVARGLSTASLGALSPVQYDHLARAYFGWLGSFVVGGGDMLARAMSDEPTKPAPDLFKFSTQGLAKEAGTGSSRYLSMVYDQAEELEKVYATHRQLIKDRKLEEAKTYAEDNQEALGRYRQVEHVKKQETLLNARIRFIERSGATADEKKAQIDALNKRKEQVAMRIAPGLN